MRLSKKPTPCYNGMDTLTYSPFNGWKTLISSPKVMNPATLRYEWRDINWREIEKNVFKLQKRIFRASHNGNVQLTRKLQRLLYNSRSAKLLAIRRVTQDNQGKKTAGVDGVKSLKPIARLELVSQLKLGLKPKPTRRVWIPKPNSEEKRPLGIPTMLDRALQALVKLGLEPEWEARFEPNSYGFRPGRCAHDAIGAIFDSIKYKPKFVLDADISKCFDKINHEKLLDKLQTFPSLRRQIKMWLKSGVMDGETLFPTEEGTPQGGVISPLLANIALHGMEIIVKQYALSFKGRKADNLTALSLIRYADDFVVMHADLEVVLTVKEKISEWLAEMGLELKPSKTRMTHTLNEHEGNLGFNFLGFHIRQFKVGDRNSGKLHGKFLGFKTLIKPSNENILRHDKRLREVTEALKNAPQSSLIKYLNPIIRGWSNYFSTVVSRKTFERCDHKLFQTLFAWAKRRHPKKGTTWIVNKYWHTVGTDNWVFNEEGYKLRRHSETKVIRHVKVKGEASPFNGEDTYWASRLGKHPEIPTEVALLLKQQKGKCNHCGLTFKDGDLMEIDHVTPKALKGNNKIDNKQLLHRHCHDIKTRDDMDCIRKNRETEERNEMKISRSVLKTSLNGDIPA